MLPLYAPEVYPSVSAVVVVIAVIDARANITFGLNDSAPIAQVASQLIDWGIQPAFVVPLRHSRRTTPGLLHAAIGETR